MSDKVKLFDNELKTKTKPGLFQKLSNKEISKSILLYEDFDKGFEKIYLNT
jgi:hypothetical protein